MSMDFSLPGGKRFKFRFRSCTRVPSTRKISTRRSATFLTSLQPTPLNIWRAQLKDCFPTGTYLIQESSRYLPSTSIGGILGVEHVASGSSTSGGWQNRPPRTHVTSHWSGALSKGRHSVPHFLPQYLSEKGTEGNIDQWGLNHCCCCL